MRESDWRAPARSDPNGAICGPIRPSTTSRSSTRIADEQERTFEGRWSAALPGVWPGVEDDLRRFPGTSSVAPSPNVATSRIGTVR